MEKYKRVPASGDLVKVLTAERDPLTGELEHTWKSGVLLEVSTSINFDSLLWVEVLVDGEKLITTPDKINPV
jgi:hypothetical protein|tara:strand:+ start:1133 stop:1348 length:216 start_codon:yes stop_codon:yes gene_type:complete